MTTFEEAVTDFVRTLAQRPIGGVMVKGTPECDLQEITILARVTMDRIDPDWRQK